MAVEENTVDALMDRKKEKAKWLIEMASPNGTCLECHLHTDKDGYCHVGISKSNYRAHRIVYECLIGPINELQVLHSCDNPMCINPAHLFLGTQKDNMQDMIHKGRQANNGPATRALSDSAALEAFALYSNGLASQGDLARRYRVN